jgi:hypothetical protein
MKSEKHQNARTLTTIGIVHIGVSAGCHPPPEAPPGKERRQTLLVSAEMLKASSELARVSSSIVLGRKFEETVKTDRLEHRSTSDSANRRLRRILSENLGARGRKHTC